MRDPIDMAETQQMLTEMQSKLEDLPKMLAEMLAERDKMSPEDIQAIVVGIGGVARILRKAADELDKGIEGLR